MAIKKIVMGLMIGICMMIGIPAWAYADDVKGQVSFTLSYEEESLEMYQREQPEDGKGVYVFVQSIDDGTVYRFPLNASNNYGGRFDIPYGNYKVIPNPEAEPGQAVITFGDVFAVSENSPIVEIICNIGKKESESPKESGTGNGAADDESNGSQKNGIKDSPSGNPSGENTAAGENSPESESDDSSHRGPTGQNIFTFLMILVIFGLWIYNRFIKNRRR